MAELQAPESKVNSFANGISSEVEHSELTDEQLRDLIQEIRKSKKMLLVENKLLEKCFEKYANDYFQCETAKQSVSSVTDVDGYGFETSRRRSTRTSTCTSVTGTNSDVKSVSFEEKCEIAVISIKILQQEIEMMRKKKEREINQINIQLDEVDARRNDMINERAIFCKLLIENGMHPITGVIRREKVDQYFSNIFKRKSLRIERCRLNVGTMKNTLKRLNKKLKEDDFTTSFALECEILKIENAEIKERFKETELELAEVKRDFNRAVENLNKKEKKLNAICLENQILMKKVERSKRKLV